MIFILALFGHVARSGQDQKIAGPILASQFVSSMGIGMLSVVYSYNLTRMLAKWL